MTQHLPGEDRVCRRVVFRGRVQGVGFRYTAATIARRLPVNGYVMNRPDGTVELVVEAASGVADQFLDEIRRHFDRNIDEVTIDELPDDRAYERFEVRYHGR